jgi:hypothetical protein
MPSYWGAARVAAHCWGEDLRALLARRICGRCSFAGATDLGTAGAAAVLGCGRDDGGGDCGRGEGNCGRNTRWQNKAIVDAYTKDIRSSRDNN